MESYVCQPFFRASSEKQRFLPEGPTQLQDENGRRSSSLAWVSIQHNPSAKTGSLNILNLETLENKEFTLPGRPGFIAQSDRDGILYLGLENRVSIFDYHHEKWLWESKGIVENPRTAINDGFALEDGIIFGTKDVNFADPIAHLYHFDSKSGDLNPIMGGQTCSNGKFILGTSEKYLYDIDTPTKSLVKYAIEESPFALGNKEVVLDLSDRSDFPDGMRLCPNKSSAIIAFYNPNDVDHGIAHQFNLESGDIEIQWQLPKSPRVTCPEFVLMDGKVNVIFTTADEGMSPEQQSQHSEAGSLFIGDYPTNELPDARPLLSIP